MDDDDGAMLKLEGNKAKGADHLEAGSKAGPVGEERPNRVKKPNPRFIGPSWTNA